MIIAVDAGNSAIKLALVDGQVLRSEERLPTREAAARASLAATLRGLCAKAEDSPVEALVLVSVVPAWTEAVHLVAAELRINLLLADHTSIPMPTRLAQPAGVGSDRLLDAFAASRLHGSPVIVVDLGTATTVDAVDASGAFLGGAILPGIQLGMRALAFGTAQLPRVQVTELPHAIGRDTAGSISSGLLLGQIGAVRELVERIAVELSPVEDPRAMVVVTGGTSRASWAGVWVEPLGQNPPIANVVDPHLTLRGLSLLHAELAGAAT